MNEIENSEKNFDKNLGINPATMKSEIFSVSSLNYSIKKNLEVNFFDIWVEGEVSNLFFHNRRHIYFDLKDEYSKIKVVMFYENNRKLVFDIEDGLHILINGYVSVYEKRGEYQIVALDARPVGKGSLLLAFEQLKARLEKKGYFETSIKKKIPILPKRIGAVTSTGGAVIYDMVSVLSRRFGNFHLIVRNVTVQGASSSDEICSAINDLSEYGVDVIILARGGGSLEDLWAFNTEQVADTIFSCNIPVISAIGHETDFTISDFVADVRAPTPSIAAEIVILSKSEAVNEIKKIMQKMQNILQTKLLLSMKELNFLINRRIFSKPDSITINLWQETENLYLKLKSNLGFIKDHNKKRLTGCLQKLSKRNILDKVNINRKVTENYSFRIMAGVRNSYNIKKNRVRLILKELQNRSPVSILQKGFALVSRVKDNKGIKSIEDIGIGEEINVTLHDGILLSEVLNKVNKKF